MLNTPKRKQLAIQAFILNITNVATMSGNAEGMLQPQVFESLQKKIDEETEVRDVSACRSHFLFSRLTEHFQSIREIVQTLEKQG